MLILAIDTSCAACSVALVCRDRVVAEAFTNLKKNHSVMLMPMIDDVLSKSGIDIGGVDFIAATSGPGSFTGLRIGGATAKALAHAASVKIIPVPTLDALAYNVYSESKLIVPIMDARRNQVYTSFFRWSGDTVKPVSDYMAEDIRQVLKLLEQSGGAIFTGDAVGIYSELIIKSGHSIAPVSMRMPRASSVGALAFLLLDTAAPADYDSFAPFYLRVPQAEREYGLK